eukprot:CAMPEP_0170490940 /NCGR_PEP_ID=MMETSP0208-20121228/10074_1 /TAXON_ID=197538 /ORGANISM="Strombidium inclinatum, Strain S3" /LENGTH=99 /DNA_ID=CAMNT_0010766429 /DNA_START=53 /DNA_END=352 /DNA_ORIENTATION=+
MTLANRPQLNAGAQLPTLHLWMQLSSKAVEIANPDFDEQVENQASESRLIQDELIALDSSDDETDASSIILFDSSNTGNTGDSDERTHGMGAFSWDDAI